MARAGFVGEALGRLGRPLVKFAIASGTAGLFFGGIAHFYNQSLLGEDAAGKKESAKRPVQAEESYKGNRDTSKTAPSGMYNESHLRPKREGKK